MLLVRCWVFISLRLLPLSRLVAYLSGAFPRQTRLFLSPGATRRTSSARFWRLGALKTLTCPLAEGGFCPLTTPLFSAMAGRSGERPLPLLVKERCRSGWRQNRARAEATRPALSRDVQTFSATPPARPALLPAGQVRRAARSPPRRPGLLSVQSGRCFSGR